MAYSQDQLKRDLNIHHIRRPNLTMGNSHWGKSAWLFLYNCVLSFEGDMDNLKSWISMCQHVLPCPDCRRDFKDYLQKNPLPDTLYEIFNWLHILEENIAKKLGKRPHSRLKKIHKNSSNPRMYTNVNNIPVQVKLQRKVATKEAENRNKKVDRYCPDCHKSRAELGVTAARMNLEGIGGSRLGGNRGKYASRIGAFGYGR
tara:strand:+ start:4199 stop:4801 length:603 start_codon:yes stop_codon:yes gene_type:complete